MINKKNIWKLQAYSERAYRIASNLMAETGRLGVNGKGMAVVAYETRAFADALFRAVDAMNSGSGFDADLSGLLTNMNLLLQNGLLEVIRVGKIEESVHTSKSIAVALDEMRQLRDVLDELLENRRTLYLATPEASRPSPVTDASLQLFQATIGGLHFVENVRYVLEIFTYDKTTGIQYGELTLRKMRLPVIDVSAKLGLTERPADKNLGTALVINVDWHAKGSLYAVPVDGIATNCIFHSRIGMRAQPKATGFPPEYTRECWDAAEEKQFVFLDWVKIAS
jgi:chemotaxis signal transduction protein